MKKAKIILTATVVLAAVGGVFAYKAKGLTQYYKYDGTSACTVATQLKEVPVGPTSFTISATTNSTGAGCSVLTVTDAE